LLPGDKVWFGWQYATVKDVVPAGSCFKVNLDMGGWINPWYAAPKTCFFVVATPGESVAYYELIGSKAFTDFNARMKLLP
jgi:hypothetical protein